MEVFQYVVDSETENMRLDRYLKKVCNTETTNSIFKALKKGDVRVNDKKVKENYRLLLNDKISIKYLKVDTKKYINNEYKSKSIDMNNIKNSNFGSVYNNYLKDDFEKYKNMIIFENEDFFIVKKEENMPMHKGTGHKFGLSEIYKKIYNNKNINFANRLDYETSGLVIGTKTLKFLRYISEKIRNNEIQKRYMVVVSGKSKEKRFIIKNYLITTNNGVKVSKVKNNNNASKESISHFTVVEDKNILDKIYNKNKFLVKDNTTVLEVDLITGRKHQIRVQLSDYGLDVVGDKKYGFNKQKNKNNKNKFFLCCYKIAFDNYVFDIKNEVFS